MMNLGWKLHCLQRDVDQIILVLLFCFKIFSRQTKTRYKNIGASLWKEQKSLKIDKAEIRINSMESSNRTLVSSEQGNKGKNEGKE